MNKLKRILINLKAMLFLYNSKRTKPHDLIIIHNRYYSESYPTLAHKFEKDENGEYYNYRWREYEQTKYGSWVPTEHYLSTHENYRIKH